MADNIDLSAGLKPKTSPEIDLSAGLTPKTDATPPAPAVDLTSNTKGEGLYDMKGPSGVVHVPFSKVKDAQGQGYDFAKPATGARYKDDLADTKPGMFESATEPTIPELKPTTPADSSWAKNRDAAWNAAANALELGKSGVGNILKRAARTVAGTIQLPFHVIGIMSDLSSDDEATSQKAEDELLALHPGAQIADRLKEAVDDWKKSPGLATENALGDVLGMVLTEKAAKGVTKVVKGDLTAPEGIRKAAQTVVGAGERQVKAEVAGEAEKANTARDATLEANKKADEATIEARGKVDEQNRAQELVDELKRREAEEKTLKARGKVDETNAKAVADHAEAVRAAEEATLKARGAVDDANRAARLKAKGEAVTAEKAANSDEPFLEGDSVYKSARQEHDEVVQRQKDVEAKRAKLQDDEAKARQNVTQRVQAIYKAAQDYFKKGFADVAAKLDAPDKKGEVHTISYADLDGMVDEAEGKIKGSRANVSIFEDIGKKAKGVGEKKLNPLEVAGLDPDEVAMLGQYASDGTKLPGAKYSDLDGYYQEAGRVIGNPATAPDVRQAVVKFREELGKRMQKLAEEIDPKTAAKHKLLRAQYKEYAGGYRDYTGPSGSASPVAKGLQAVDAHNATEPYFDLAPEESARVKGIITGDTKEPLTQFTDKEIIGPNGKPDPAWRFRKQTHAAIQDLRNIRKGLDALPKPEKLTKDVAASEAALADARAKAREKATAKPDQKEYPERKPTPAAPEPKPYPEPEGTPPTTPPKEYGEPKGTKPIDVPELNTRQIRDKFITEKLKQWTSVSKFQLARLVAGPIGVVVGAATGHPFLEIGASIYTGAELTPFALQKLMDRPGVREWLTRPPAEEIDALKKVPHADRVRIADGLRGIAREADKSGNPVRLSPAVIAFIRDNGSAQNMKNAKRPKDSDTGASEQDIQKDLDSMQKEAQQ